jgi:hypothetical protein
MNERIKLLAEQAGVTGHFAAGTELATPIPLSPEMQKFAELIIRECAGVGSRAMYPDSDPDYVGREIRKHFGVEE